MTWIVFGILYLVSATLFYVVAAKTAAPEPGHLWIETHEQLEADRAA